jgi:hypothetical protein
MGLAAIADEQGYAGKGADCLAQLRPEWVARLNNEYCIFIHGRFPF